MNRETTKTLDYYLTLPYTIALTPEPDGGWFAEIPLLEGCITNGEDWNDALVMIEDAKRAWLMTALTLDIAIPEPDIVAE